MSDPNKLPAIPNPIDSGQSIQPYVTTEFLGAETERDVFLAPLAEEQRLILGQRSRPGQWDNKAIVANGMVDLAAVVGHFPIAADWTLVGTGALILGKVMIVTPTQQIRSQSRRRRVIQTAFASSDALTLAKRWIGVDIPEGMLDEEIEYPADTGIVRIPARALLDSAGEAAPGLRTHADKRNGRSYRQVSQVHLLRKQSHSLATNTAIVFYRRHIAR